MDDDYQKKDSDYGRSVESRSKEQEETDKEGSPQKKQCKPREGKHDENRAEQRGQYTNTMKGGLEPKRDNLQADTKREYNPTSAEPNKGQG